MADTPAGREHIVQAQPWLLSSNSAGVAVAAKLGLPMAFAHFLRPENTVAAVERNRAEFRPSRWSETSRLILAVVAVCAKAEAHVRSIDVPHARSHTQQVEQPWLDKATVAEYAFAAEENQPVIASRDSVAARPGGGPGTAR